MNIDISVDDDAHWARCLKKLGGKHKEELVQALNNFHNAMVYFDVGNEERLRKCSNLVRREKQGVLAVDQKGCSRRPPHLVRLYFYVWTDEDGGKHCLLLTIGDKGSQERDNNYCVERLRKRKLK